MKIESILVGAVLAASGLVTWYRCSLLNDLEKGTNQPVKNKYRLVSIHIFLLRIVALALIMAAIVVWIRN